MQTGETTGPDPDENGDDRAAPSVSVAPDPNGTGGRLEVLKTLGDNTRYAIYLELARSARPLTTADVAATLDLHPNTVRPHLERMRDLGLVAVSMASTGAVGRPQHRYTLAEDAPSLGLEPPAFPLLSRMLLEAMANAGIAADDVHEAGLDHGRRLHSNGPTNVVDHLVHHLDRLGFDPVLADTDDTITVCFTHCPYRAMAEAHPELVCNLHHGLVEGLVIGYPEAEVLDFHTLVDRTPCQMDLVLQ